MIKELLDKIKILDISETTQYPKNELITILEKNILQNDIELKHTIKEKNYKI